MSKHRNDHRPEVMRPPKMSLADVDIVIPVYGQLDLYKKCLEAIPAAAGKVHYNVIAVNDAHEDRTGFQTVSAGVPFPVNAVQNHDNLGFGATCNRGAKAGGAKYILFLNTDVELLPFSLEWMMEAITHDERIAVVGPKLLFPEDESDPSRPAGKVQHAGMEINIHGDPIHVFVGWDKDHPKVNNVRSVPAVTGACFLTRREIFQSVGGFDPIWGRGTYEDVDYCYKVQTFGKVCVYIPKAEGYHKVGASVIPTGVGYPLQQNNSLFKARWGGYLRWTDFEVW